MPPATVGAEKLVPAHVLKEVALPVVASRICRRRSSCRSKGLFTGAELGRLRAVEICPSEGSADGILFRSFQREAIQRDDVFGSRSRKCASRLQQSRCRATSEINDHILDFTDGLIANVRVLPAQCARAH